MHSFNITMRRTLDQARGLRENVARTGRLTLAAAIAATMLAPTLPAPTPAFAQTPIVRDHRDPYARIQVEIKRIIVHDDMDWGDGEIAIGYSVCRSAPTGACEADLLSGGVHQFSASDGPSKIVNRSIPAYGDTTQDEAIAPPFGIPIRPGQQYKLTISGRERDAASDDILGDLRVPLIGENGEIPFGTYTERGTRNDCEFFGDCGKEPATFSVEYEIRRAPLPDLRPVGITINDLPGNPKKLVCVQIQNTEVKDAGAFDVTLKVDGTTAGKATAGHLRSGDAGGLCTELALPTTGQHKLTSVVDEGDGVIEYNERNNVHEQEYTAPRQAAAPEPESDSSAATPEPESNATRQSAASDAGQPDLIISTIKVNGQAPDGKDVCKDGKSTVTVLVKNGGDASTRGSTVRLVVDDAKSNAMERSVGAIEAGKEREIRFDDVRIAKGKHKLTVSVDSKGAIAESDEDNNDDTVSVTCSAN